MVPRRTGHGAGLQVCHRRHQALDLGGDEIAPLGVAEILDDLGHAEHAHGDDDEADAVEEIADAEREARVAGIDVGADETQQHAEEDHAHGLDHRARRHDHGEHEAEHHQREIVGRRELLRELGQRRRREHDQECRDGAREERADRGNRQRRTGAALPCHGVAIERGDDRRRLARQIDQNGRGRAAILRAVVDAGEHDQRAFRRQEVSDRQQQRHRRHRTDTRQHADGRADQGAHEAPEQGS